MKPKRTELDRRLERFNRLRERVFSIYARARIERLSHDAIEAQLRASVYTHPDYTRLGRELSAQLSGCVHTWRERIWREDVVWRLGDSTGPLPEDHNWNEDSPLSKLCREPGKLFGGHFWAGTSYQYTGYVCTNPADQAAATP